MYEVSFCLELYCGNVPFAFVIWNLIVSRPAEFFKRYLRFTCCFSVSSSTSTSVFSSFSKIFVESMVCISKYRWINDSGEFVCNDANRSDMFGSGETPSWYLWKEARRWLRSSKRQQSISERNDSDWYLQIDSNQMNECEWTNARFSFAYFRTLYSHVMNSMCDENSCKHLLNMGLLSFKKSIEPCNTIASLMVRTCVQASRKM